MRLIGIVLAFLVSLEQKMWLCLCPQWEREECAWNWVSDGLKEVGLEPVAQRIPMILCLGLGDGKTDPSARGLLWTQRVLTSEELGAQVASSLVSLQKTCH